MTQQHDSRLSGVDAYVESSLEDWDLPGLSVAIVYKDEVEFAAGYGVKQVGRSDPNDAETLFQIGSTSKAFAAAAMAALVDDGAITWDDKVIDIIPEFQTSNQNVTQSASVRTLLAHTSGIGGDIGSSVKIMSAETAFERLARPGTTLDEPGTYLYSNSGYGVTEIVAAGAYKSTWHDLVRERLLEPSGMLQSTPTPYDVLQPKFIAPTFLGGAPVGETSIDDAPQRNIAMPHGYGRDGARRVLPWKSYESLAPAGGVVSNASDMVQWLKLWLNEGVVDGKRVLSSEVVNEMIRPQVADKDGYFLLADEDVPSQYALGWSVGSVRGRRVIYHGGGIFGFPAFVAFFPDDGLGVAVMANGNTLSPYYPHQEIVAWAAERFIGLETGDLRQETLEGLRSYRAEFEEGRDAKIGIHDANSPPTLPLINYTGRFQSGPEEADLGTASIVLGEETLRFSLSEPGELAGELVPWSQDTFRLYYDGGDGVAWEGEMARFDVEDGQVRSVSFDLLNTFHKVE